MVGNRSRSFGDANRLPSTRPHVAIKIDRGGVAVVRPTAYFLSRGSGGIRREQ